MSIERFLLFKSAQNIDLYHRDYLAAPNGVNKEVNMIHWSPGYCRRLKKRPTEIFAILD